MTQRLQLLMKLRREGNSQIEAEKLCDEFFAAQPKPATLPRIGPEDLTWNKNLKIRGWQPTTFMV